MAANRLAVNNDFIVEGCLGGRQTEQRFDGNVCAAEAVRPIPACQMIFCRPAGIGKAEPGKDVRRTSVQQADAGGARVVAGEDQPVVTCSITENAGRHTRRAGAGVCIVDFVPHA